MNALITVFRKELTDLFRDRRTVVLALVTGPLLTVLMVHIVGASIAQSVSEINEPITLQATGAEAAPNLVGFLKTQNIVLTVAEGDPEEAIREQRAELTVRFESRYAEHWRASQPAVVELIYDGTRSAATTLASRLQRVLGAYSEQVGTARLLARGINPTVRQGVVASARDLSTPTSRANQSLMFLPFMLLMVVFLGSVPPAVDNTAGERERQSLEPLLANPVSPALMMCGKIAATSVFTGLLLALTLAALGFLAGVTGAMSVSPATLASIGLTLVPMVLVASTLISLLAAGSKSVKEAQSYVAGITMLPMISMMLAMRPPENALWVSVSPLVSQNHLIMKLVRGEALASLDWVLSVGPTLTIAGALSWLATRRYRDERFIISA